jgi:hypothetical protein
MSPDQVPGQGRSGHIQDQARGRIHAGVREGARPGGVMPPGLVTGYPSNCL